MLVRFWGWGGYSVLQRKKRKEMPYTKNRTQMSSFTEVLIQKHDSRSPYLVYPVPHSQKTKNNPGLRQKTIREKGSPWQKGGRKKGDEGRRALKEMKHLERQDVKMIKFPSHKRMGSLVYVPYILSPCMYSAGPVYPEAS